MGIALSMEQDPQELVFYLHSTHPPSPPPPTLTCDHDLDKYKILQEKRGVVFTL